jgi:hypothetical protein
MARPAHVSVTRQLTGKVRSEKHSSERFVVRPSLMVADFPVGGLGAVFAAGMALG